MSCFKGLKSLYTKLSLFTLASVFSAMAWAEGPDPTKDLLANAKAEIITNFGPTSTVAYIIYLIEVIAGVAAYIKTKNLFALIGIVVVVIFTSVAFTMIGGSNP